MRPEGDLTEVVRRWRKGDDRALDELLVAVHREVRRSLAGQLRRGPAPHTLQPAALSQAAFLRLVDPERVTWHDRVHLLAVTARVARRVLVAHARRRSALGRAAAARPLHLDSGAVPPSGGLELDIVALDDALGRLAVLDPRQARVVELRYFGGLLIEEAADVLLISATIAGRDWESARLWLYAQLRDVTAPSQAGARL